MPELDRYLPQSPKRFALVAGEVVRHTFLLRGFRWVLEKGGEPTRSLHFGHLTSKRFVLEPADASDTSEPIAIPWNDVIEFEFAEGSLAQQRIPGIDDFMIHCSTKDAVFDAPTELFLFTCAPVSPERVAEPRAHGEAFIELADDLMVEAFE